jgi:hypothetical protein
MNPPLKAMALTLLAAVMAWSVPACSRDLATGPTAKAPPGAAQADVSTWAAPTNDDFDNALVITSLPFTTNVSTVEATTAADDPVGDEDCGFDSIDGHTVWYRFTPTQNVRINANTVGTRGIDHNIFVYTGTRGNLTRVACNFLPQSMTFDAIAGEAYFFLVGSSDDAPGRAVVFTVQLSLDVTVTIDQVGKLNLATGAVPVSGTLTCSRSAFVEGGVSVERRVGGNLVTGSVDFPSSSCDGVTPWEVEVVADNGRFLPGPAKVRAGGLFTDNGSTEERHGSAAATVILMRGQ